VICLDIWEPQCA